MTRRRPHPRTLLLMVALLALAVAGCSSSEQGRSAQSLTPPPVVTIKSPIPVVRDGTLTISIGNGRIIEAAVTPASRLDSVVLRATEPDQLLARVAHAPFKFFAPGWTAGEGGRTLCITATDIAGQVGESCFVAIR